MISVYGASDDNVCIEGDVYDEVSPGKTILIGDSTRGVRIKFKYGVGKTATWRGSVVQVDEGVPMFPISVVDADPSRYPDPRSYSVKVIVDCPPGTPVMVGKKNLAKSV